MSEKAYKILTDDEFDKLYGETASEDTIPSPPLGLLWGELKEQVFPPIERFLFGLSRGQVGMTIASTNVGKTTYALNVALSLATGLPFVPFIGAHAGGRRVLLIDGENTRHELQLDLIRMTRDWVAWDRNILGQNLLVICDEEIDEEPLTLTNERHLAAVLRRAEEFKPDLIIVDTLAALFDVTSENDNAEIKQRVMSPLKQLARASNSVVWLQHHIGKQGEDALAAVNAYRGRGASNLGALSRVVVALTNPDRKERERVQLSVVKAKGYKQNDVVMRLDNESRWFTVTDEKPPVVTTPLDDVVTHVVETGGAKTAEIVAAFTGMYGRRTVEDALSKAEARGLLIKPRRAWYEPPQTALSAPSYDGSGTAETGSDEAIELGDVQQLSSDEYTF
jgi:hypothetical protein